MATGQGHPPVPSSYRSAIRAVLVRIPLLLLAWGALTEGAGWVTGLLASAVIAPVSLLLAAPKRGRIRAAAGLLTLFPLFARESLLGGWDVARRALSIRRIVRPRMELVRLAAPSEAVATALAFAITLMPGTLVVELDRRRLLVHAIDRERDDCRSIRDLNRRLSKVLGEPE